MSNTVCSKTIENLRNVINVKLVNSYLKRTSSYMSQEIFDNDLFSCDTEK